MWDAGPRIRDLLCIGENPLDEEVGRDRVHPPMNDHQNPPAKPRMAMQSKIAKATSTARIFFSSLHFASQRPSFMTLDS